MLDDIQNQSVAQNAGIVPNPLSGISMLKHKTNMILLPREGLSRQGQRDLIGDRH
jgi:hypothetical protein